MEQQTIVSETQTKSISKIDLHDGEYGCLYVTHNGIRVMWTMRIGEYYYMTTIMRRGANKGRNRAFVYTRNGICKTLTKFGSRLTMLNIKEQLA